MKMEKITAWCEIKNKPVDYNWDEVTEEYGKQRFKREIKCKECGKPLFLHAFSIEKLKNGVTIIRSKYEHEGAIANIKE